MGKGRAWTDEEVSLVRDNPEMDPAILAEKLGRTVPAVNQVRWKLNPGGQKRGRGTLWTADDVQFVKDNLEEDAGTLAEMLGRSKHSVNQVKSRLRKQDDEVPESCDYDIRPSGWYEDTIGILLLSFPNVMATWRHYHKYVKVIYVETQRTGWVTINCLRDASCNLTEEEFLELPYS